MLMLINAGDILLLCRLGKQCMMQHMPLEWARNTEFPGMMQHVTQYMTKPRGTLGLVCIERYD